jgi:hypothetical protein
MREEPRGWPRGEEVDERGEKFEDVMPSLLL